MTVFDLRQQRMQCCHLALASHKHASHTPPLPPQGRRLRGPPQHLVRRRRYRCAWLTHGPYPLKTHSSTHQLASRVAEHDGARLCQPQQMLDNLRGVVHSQGNPAWVSPDGAYDHFSRMHGHTHGRLASG
jgi:hypothetical protein